ncbi:hypothetical protein FOZ60_004974 [Perkinsus olseni]|uniref:Uncharacterized protein n=1 Tax=Perkinsus olseni TaxID=32597 RepID=A0A7J6NSA2_PEROL|nr:hypothetical protein FOZ60_004974 [Perkinsus olseni]
MAATLTEASFSDYVSPACSPELAQQLFTVLQEMGARWLSDIPAMVAEEELLAKFLEKVAPKAEVETDQMSLQRSMLRARARGELLRVCDNLKGKKQPVEQVKGDYLVKATSRYGGFLSSHLTVGQDVLTKVMTDPGVYQELKFHQDGPIESIDDQPQSDGDDGDQGKKGRAGPSSSARGRSPASLGELLVALLPLLVAIDVSTAERRGNLVAEYVVFLCNISILYGEDCAIRLDKSYRRRLSVLAHKAAREGDMTYLAGVAQSLSRASELCGADMVAMGAMSRRQNDGARDGQHDQPRGGRASSPGDLGEKGVPVGASWPCVGEFEGGGPEDSRPEDPESEAEGSLRRGLLAKEE